MSEPDAASVTTNDIVTGSDPSSSWANEQEMSGDVTVAPDHGQEPQKDEDRKPPPTSSNNPPTSLASDKETTGSDSLPHATGAASEEPRRRPERRQRGRRRGQERSPRTASKGQYYNSNNNTGTTPPPKNPPNLSTNVDVSEDVSESSLLLQMDELSRVSSDNLEEFRQSATTATLQSSYASTASASIRSASPAKGMSLSTGSRYSSPGAYTSTERAIGDRPSWATDELLTPKPKEPVRIPSISSVPLLEATLVMTDEAFTKEKKDASEVEDVDAEAGAAVSRDPINIEPMEVEPSVLAQAVPIDPRQKYYCFSAFCLVIAVGLVVIVFAVGLGNVWWGQDSNSTTPIDINATVATVPQSICYERNPGAGFSALCSVNDTLAQGGGVGNLVAQSFLAAFPEADLVIENAGMMGGDIARGNFTAFDAEALLPLGIPLVLLQMTGSEIRLVLEMALNSIFSDPRQPRTGAYPYAAALKYAVNMTAEYGNRLSDMQVKERETGTWGSLNASKEYTVLVNSFIVAFLVSGGGLVVFETIKEQEQTGREVFLQYALDQGVLLDPSLDDYSTISYIPPQL